MNWQGFYEWVEKEYSSDLRSTCEEIVQQQGADELSPVDVLTRALSKEHHEELAEIAELDSLAFDSDDFEDLRKAGAEE